MWIILGLLATLAALAAMILPWIQWFSIRQLKQDVADLKRQLQAGAPPSSPQEEPPAFVAPAQVTVPETPAPRPEPYAVVLMQAPEASVQSPAAPAKPKLSFEQQFGARLPVWIGGIALACAGFFMVKYSIETGLLSPSVRIILGVIFGLGLLAAAEYLRVTHPQLANGRRITQAMTGAGIADLYVCFYAATSLYGLLPDILGFAAMTCVTIGAVTLSLRHGMPIAALGLLGGMITPLATPSDAPSAPMLLGYLALVMAGVFYVIQRQGWWRLAMPTLLGGLLWAFLWDTASPNPGQDVLWLALFLMAAPAGYLYVTAAREVPLLGRFAFRVGDVAAVFLGLFLLMAMVFDANLSPLATTLFAIATAGVLGMTTLAQSRLAFAPWLAVAFGLLLLTGPIGDRAAFAQMALVLASVPILGGIWLQTREPRPLLWSGIAATTLVLYYLVAYARLMPPVFEESRQILADIPYFWGLLAAGIAFLAFNNFRYFMTRMANDHPQKSSVLSLSAALTSTFVTLGFTVELEREFLSVALALQVLALAWINTRVDIARLRWIIAAVAIAFAVLLIPQFLLLVQLTAFSLVEAQLPLQASLPIVNWPLFQLGVPAVGFLAATRLLLRDHDDRLVRILEVSAIGLIAIMGYYLSRHAFHPGSDILFVKAGFAERGMITNVLFAYGLACMAVGRALGRRWVTISGLALAGVAIFRLTYFDLLVYMPLWSPQSVGSLPLFNALLLTYALPLLWALLLRRQMVALAWLPRWQPYLGGWMLVMVFTLITTQVTQLFRGSVFQEMTATNAEFYAYSVAWLLLGIALLLVGTKRDDKMLRVASLLVMMLTVGKVFLFDASELSGLLRVFSFLGLGLSLLGLSWFYMRFVFGGKKANETGVQR